MVVLMRFYICTLFYYKRGAVQDLLEFYDVLILHLSRKLF